MDTADTLTTAVTITTLDMSDPGQLRPRNPPPGNLAVRRVTHPLPEFNRFLYTAVGADWYWIDRLAWDYSHWLAWVDRPTLETWVLYLDDTPAGYFELDMQSGGDVEVAYFGLLPAFTGRGLGGYLLTRAVQRAWQRGAARVWLHTCTLDHPSALANYRARGFREVSTVTEQRRIPPRSPGPWPGARQQDPPGAQP